MNGASQTCSGPVRAALRLDEAAPQRLAPQLLQLIRPRWLPQRIRYKTFTDGITNKLVGCFYDDVESDKNDTVLIRIYGNKTDLLIDRKAELRNMKLLHEAGLAPCLYAVFDNGLAYKYLSGVTLTIHSVIDLKVWQLVATQMAMMHKVRQDPEIPFVPILWTKSEKFLNLIPESYSKESIQSRFEETIRPVCDLRKELNYLKKHLSELGSPTVFAHNDLLLGNVIYNEDENKVTFIDYEYTDYNYQAFDIGNHFAEFAGLSEVDYSRFPSKEFQMPWLTKYLETYLDRDVNIEEVETLYVQVNQFVLATHFFWGLWCLIQTEYSHIDFDFLGYAATRFNEYFKIKEKMLSMTIKS